MSLFLGLLILSFIVNSLLIIPFINLLYSLRLYKNKSAVSLSKKDKASEHIRTKAKTPEGGGLLTLVITSLLFALLFPLVRFLGVYIYANYSINEEINIIFFTFISFGLLGLYDDVVKFFELQRELGYAGLKGGHKFVIQWSLGFVIAAMLYFNLGIHIVNIPFFSVIDLGYWFIPLAAFFIVGMSNAVNITDGMDGLAAGMLMIALFGFWVLSVTILDTPLSIFLALWIGGLIAFLYFNVYPARLFMGDVGAISFGATFAVVALLLGKVVAAIVIGSPFILNAASSFIQIAGVKIFHRRLLPIAPIHYWLLKIGWSEPKIVQRSWLATILLVIFGLWLASI
jgi:phospho-N-acetylmuramoyl-pentapeptide-transferase